MILVYGADAAVMEWVQQRTPWVEGFGDARAIGVARDGKLIAGLVYLNYRKTNIEICLAADDPRWCRKGVLAALFHFPFIQLRVRRMTAIIPASNERSLRLGEGLGFVREGRHEGLFANGEAGISMGLLRENCRWLGDIADVDKRQAA